MATSEQIMSEAIERNCGGGTTLDEAIEILNKDKNDGINSYINFNGKNLYSLIDNAESCYLIVTGMRKVDFEKKQKDFMAKTEALESQAKLQAKLMVETWIKEGDKFIYPQRHDDWVNCVNVCAEGIYHGTDIKCALEIIKNLDSAKSFESAVQLLDSQDHSGASYSRVLSIVRDFSKIGPEFFEHVEPERAKNDPNIAERLAERKKDNKHYEQIAKDKSQARLL